MPVEIVRIKNSIPRYLRLLAPLWFFSAFFTGIKLLPQLANNVGLFEVIGATVAVLFFALEERSAGAGRHPLVSLTFVLCVVALISQLQIPDHLRRQGLVQVAILLFLLVFLMVFSGLVRKYHLPPSWLLRIVVVCVLICGIVVVKSGVGEAAGTVAGPFRNRAHMASYMLTAFWLCLTAVFWPGFKAWVRYAGFAALLLALYSVAISGRRSVYLSLFLGLGGLVLALLAAQKGKRVRWLLGVGVAVGFLVGLYWAGDRLGEQSAFFQRRVGLVDDRLRSFLGVEEAAAENSFFALQRAGVMAALRASPVLGIGWGGFADSQYSPTSHEVHSTPLRFLAELGLVGLGLYAYLLGFLLSRSARLFVRMRSSPYAGSYLVLAIAVWSMTVSYVYNRHITERTFWILLALFLCMETFAADWHALKARFAFDGAAEKTVETAAQRAASPPRIRPRLSPGLFR